MDQRTNVSDRLRRAVGPGKVSSDFDLNPGTTPPADRLRPAGVLIGVTPRQSLLLTKRSSHLKHHPGQIALPGGKVEETDDGVIGAALREAREEVALPSDEVEVLGTLPSHHTVTGFLVTPVVALVPDFAVRAEPGEVDEVFEVPLAHLLDAGNYVVQSRIWRGTPRHYYAVPWGPYYIWGATARILRVLAERMR